jgi:hypothetical protein
LSSAFASLIVSGTGCFSILAGRSTSSRELDARQLRAELDNQRLEMQMSARAIRIAEFANAHAGGEVAQGTLLSGPVRATLATPTVAAAVIFTAFIASTFAVNNFGGSMPTGAPAAKKDARDNASIDELLELHNRR